MGFDYAMVHVKYTIPPALLLSFLCRPLLSRLALYKVAALVLVAVVSTIPWDSYLIRTNIWSYPPNAIIGPTVFSIPAEELFFFVIQTYNTALFYTLLSKATFYPKYLLSKERRENAALERVNAKLDETSSRIIGQFVIAAVSVWAGITVLGFRQDGTTAGIAYTKYQYFALILAWAGPFLFLLWSLAYTFIVRLPLINTIVPIAIPTLYLWMVDTLALKRGTWVIESGTKLGIYLWDGLELEEASFFLVTNTMIVFGLVAFDYALSVLHTFPDLFPDVVDLPSPALLLKAIFTSSSAYDEARVNGLIEAVERLRKKSRSFYLASTFFEGRLGIDLILLYSFCRVADDLVDTAATTDEAKRQLRFLFEFVDVAYKTKDVCDTKRRQAVVDKFPKTARSALMLLPTKYLPKEPILNLLKGLESDLAFQEGLSFTWPIRNDEDLAVYASQVASTVAELCLELVFYHDNVISDKPHCRYLVDAAVRMGIALQYTNIARDILVDAQMGRVYIPTSWLKEVDLTPEDVVDQPSGVKIEDLRQKLLEKAARLYSASRGAIEELPASARGPMRVAVESYMEIGRVLREKSYTIRAGKATVPKLRRLRVAWKALNQG